MKKRNNTQLHMKTFEESLLEAIDEGLTSLGESAKTAIYFHLEKKYGVKKIEIPNRLEDFSDFLEQIFGSGARNLEILIMAKLHEKINCVYEWNGPNWLVPNLTFTKYVELLRLPYEDRKKIGELEVWVIAEEQKQHI
ncbi:MAG: hypothetical protein ABSA75_09705 [Candidatus Bathyarchaeia archaeon]|jgi:hypothetical protein